MACKQSRKQSQNTNTKQRRKDHGIQFNLNALSRFSNVNFGDNDAIANLDGGQRPGGELLKDLVKKSVDLFIHTTESKHGENYKSVINIVSTEDARVDEILSRLDNVSGVIRGVDQYWEKKERQPDEESVSEFEEDNASFLDE